MTKVAIIAFLRGSGWIGGMNYFKSMVAALQTHPCDEKFEVKVLTNHPEHFKLKDKKGVDVIDAPWVAPNRSIFNFVNAAVKTSGLINPLLYRFIKHEGIDLLTHSTVCIVNPCHTVFWMADFQHLYYPQYFSLYERTRRSRNVRIAAKKGYLLFSSYSAVADFKRYFYDLKNSKTFVMQFTPLKNEEEASVEWELIARKYHIEQPYFLLPNQFWKHKNHLCVIEALHRLPRQIIVVCTGALYDSRDPGYTRNLLRKVHEYSLANRFKILGIVPSTDLMVLIQNSLCVLNPSHFEGWSTTVEEAKYFGKRVILSDIPVHREQDPEDAIFFDPTDYKSLAQAMKIAIQDNDPLKEKARAARGKENYKVDQKRFASQYWSIVKHITKQ